MEEKGILCCKCRTPLEPRPVRFSYLGKDFTHEMPKCPQCGCVYVPEEIAVGKMAEVERMLEGK